MTLEELQIKFTADTAGLRTQLQGVERQIGSLEKSASKAQDFLKGFAKGAVITGVALVGRKMVQVGNEALAMANDVVESEQLFEVSMGRMADKARSWSDKISGELGLNPYDLRKNVGMLNVMFDSMGLGEQEAYDMATSLTELANDMASFYNLDTEEAFTKLRAGITGETEPLKRLGILVDEQTVAQYALKSGISKTGKELTQQQKLQARYGAIMEQTMKAQGDLARTMDSPTNQLRRLNAEFDMAKIALGQALQPALIAVLPHVTNFATGLTRMLKGGAGGDPLSGTINDLAGATAAIKSRVDASIVDIVADIARLQGATEAAVDGYIQAASETRALYLNINLKPQNSVYTRINNIFADLDRQIDTAATQNLKGEVKKRLDVILQDGVVTGPERQSLLDYLAEIEAKLKKEAREKLKAVQAEAKYKLNTGEIDLPTHDQLLIAAQTEYDTSIGVIDSLIAEAKAEVGISDWTASTISATDRQRMTDAINKEIAAGDALLVTAKAQAQALFEGSSLETAVMGIYGDLTTKIQKNNETLQEMLNGWYEGHEIDWDEAWRIRQENADFLAIATGGLTAEGEARKLALGLGDATPEEIANFAKGYKEAFKPVADSFKKIYDDRVNFIASLPDEYIEAQGTTRKGMYDTAKSEYEANIAGASGTIMDAAMEGLAPQINKLFGDSANADIFDVAALRDAVGELAQSMDDAGQDAMKLWDLESQLGGLADWLDFSARDLDTRNKGMPDWWRDESRLIPPLTQYYDPMAYENKGYKDLVFSGADITIESPRMKYQSMPDGYAGRGGSFDVNVDVAPQDIVVNLYLDETQLGRANIRATQTVTRSTGGGGSHVHAILGAD
jgi:hypothetical protein